MTMQRPTARIRIWRLGRIGAAALVSIAGVRVSHAQNPLPVATARSNADSVATLTGVVQDEEGLGVAGALVMADSGRRRATADEYGHFRLEGIPAGRARVEVRSYGHAPLGFDCEIGAGLTVEVALTMLPVPPSANVVVEQLDSLPIPGAPAVIEGLVTDSAGVPIAGVTLKGMSTSLEAESGPDGTFRLARVKPGLHVIRARKLGLLPEYLQLRIPAGWRVRLSVRLRPLSDAPQLARVTIREDARMMGFYERKRRNDGIFLTREELERKDVLEVTDALRGRNAVELRRYRPMGDPVIVNQYGCPLGVLIDGFTIPWDDISLDRMVGVKNVRALEVYTSGRAVPLGFQRRETLCGAVLIWTR
jgi:Carboxypeptidase regulatory-like domain